MSVKNRVLIIYLFVIMFQGCLNTHESYPSKLIHLKIQTDAHAEVMGGSHHVVETQDEHKIVRIDFDKVKGGKHCYSVKSNYRKVMVTNQKG